MARRAFYSSVMKILLYGAVIAVAVAPPVAHAQAVSLPELPRATVESVERLITDKMARDKIPGLSIALVVDGEPVWSSGYGLADVENSVPAVAATVYRTASIGKTMTATSAMQLAERGRMDIDKPVQVYCPAFPKKRWLVTSRHLLGRTSGIRHYGGPRNEEELFNAVHYERVVDALETFKNDRLRFKPGTKHRYSTFGYNVLGCVVEGASGTDFLTYMRKNVFEPAGMTSTRGDREGDARARDAGGRIGCFTIALPHGRADRPRCHALRFGESSRHREKDKNRLNSTVSGPRLLDTSWSRRGEGPAMDGHAFQADAAHDSLEFPPGCGVDRSLLFVGPGRRSSDTRGPAVPDGRRDHRRGRLRSGDANRGGRRKRISRRVDRHPHRRVVLG